MSKFNKKIMLVGGGSGGHLTPLIAVASAIKELDPYSTVVDVGQRGEDLSEVTDHPAIDEWYSIYAGKFRRYHGESFFSHLLDYKTMMFNIRDLFRFILGTVQAFRLLGKVKPDSIMLKGGFVCVPIGIAAWLRRVPYITHDSDAIPGLANKLTSKHALYNTTALPADAYPYDQRKTIQVGIPLQSSFSRIDDAAKSSAKVGLGFEPNTPVIFSVGGGLGAQRINEALVSASSKLFSEIPNLILIHITGKKLFKETQSAYSASLPDKYIPNIKLIDFSTELHRLSAAADIIITRAGATNIAEFALQGKPAIVIPGSQLTGGQQLQNAKVLEDHKAAIVLQEGNLDQLANIAIDLIRSKEKSKLLGDTFYKISQSDSAEKIAKILLDAAELKS